MTVSYLIGFLIPYIVIALYFNFNLSPFSGSPISSKIILINLMFGFFIIGIVILVERSLVAEKTIIEEKTERILSEKELLKNQNLPDYCENRNKCASCGLRETCYNEEEVSELLQQN